MAARPSAKIISRSERPPPEPPAHAAAFWFAVGSSNTGLPPRLIFCSPRPGGTGLGAVLVGHSFVR